MKLEPDGLYLNERVRRVEKNLFGWKGARVGRRRPVNHNSMRRSNTITRSRRASSVSNTVHASGTGLPR